MFDGWEDGVLPVAEMGVSECHKVRGHGNDGTYSDV